MKNSQIYRLESVFDTLALGDLIVDGLKYWIILDYNSMTDFFCNTDFSFHFQSDL